MALVETDLAGGVMTITLADEENRNALGPHLMSELADALDIADSDPAVRVVVLTNKGRVFCAGANLAERSSGEKADSHHQHRWMCSGVFGDRRSLSSVASPGIAWQAAWVWPRPWTCRWPLTMPSSASPRPVSGWPLRS